MSLIIWNLPNLMSIELVMLSNHLILCHLFSFCLQSFQSSSKYSGLIFFRIDWFDLLAVQGTLKSLQHHSQKHQFFGLNFLYGPTLTSVFDISISSVQFSRSVVSDSLWPHELQHARPPCPSPAPRVYPNPCPSSWWCYPAISSSVIPFSSCPQSFPASGSFPMNQFFAWGGQSIGVSASASVLPMNTQDSFPLGWTIILSSLFKLIFLVDNVLICWDCLNKVHGGVNQTEIISQFWTLEVQGQSNDWQDSFSENCGGESVSCHLPSFQFFADNFSGFSFPEV